MRWVPRAIRPIAADDVAAALIEAALDSPPGTRILSSKHMLGRGNERQSR
jgi:hypothetical protein